MIKSSSPSERIEKWSILCDFDGTITLNDVTDSLLQGFAREGWEDIEQQWKIGVIGSRQCMSEQIKLLEITKVQLDEFLQQVEIDPHFIHFVQLTRRAEIPLFIVSDGLDYVIKKVLQYHGIEGIPVLANRLKQVDEKSWELLFPYYDKNCSLSNGMCKCSIARKYVSGKSLLIGDGQSDFCAAQVVDYVFAKKQLITLCRQKGIAYSRFDDFADITKMLETRLNTKTEQSMVEIVL